MTEPTAPIPDRTYFDGLRHVDANTFEAIYTEFRRPVTRAIEAAGGSSADGSTFFRVAVIHASSLVRDGKLDESVPIQNWLNSLAITHFRDWAFEKNVELPAAPPEPETAYPIEMPDSEARQEFRQNIRAKRQFSRLEADCQKIIQELAHDAAINISDPRLETDAVSPCIEKYRRNLGETAETWAEPMPAWAITALSDEQFQKAWSMAETMESRLAMGLSATPGPKSKVTRNVLIALGLLLLGFGIWTYFNPRITPQKVYDENFKPPSSIMADREARFAKDTLQITRVEACEQLFAEADEYYKQEAYRDAAGVLYSITGGEADGCKSDALFYLAIVALQLDEPEITIECLAKIPDLERFGEDLYWYQALAFVKIAAQNPLRRDIARRAVERARSNTEIPERRAQAEKMLEQLGK